MNVSCFKRYHIIINFISATLLYFLLFSIITIAINITINALFFLPLPPQQDDIKYILDVFNDILSSNKYLCVIIWQKTREA